MKIQDLLRKSLADVLKTLGIKSINYSDIGIEYPADVSHGDFSSNVAMVLFKVAKEESGDSFQFNSPKMFAEGIVSKLLANKDSNSEFTEIIESVSVAGPGFINFALSDAFLLSKMGTIIQNRGSLAQKVGDGKKIVAEYSSPNIAKPFTVGHLRSTIIGDALANLYQAIGYEVFRDNHLGDWGTQFGKQIYAIKNWGSEAEIENADNPVKELVKLYVRFHEEAQKDVSIEDEARAWFTRLENGDEEARRLWKKCINWSWKEFEKIYKLLDVSFTENNGKGYGESFFEDKMTEVIKELEEKKLLTDSEEAKLVFFPENIYPPLMILKKDGSTLYSTRDLATDKFRLQQYGPDITIFNEVGSEQSLYFKQLYKIEQMLGWYSTEQRVHVGHGLIRFKDKKMSTRKGNVIWLDDVLTEAKNRVTVVSDGLNEKDIWKIAIGALKWNDLKRNMLVPMVFDWDELTNIKGNSGPYMQYTYVRCISVLAKAENEASRLLPAKENNEETGHKLADSDTKQTESENKDRVDTLDDTAVYIDTLINIKSYLKSELQEDEKNILRNLFRYYDIVELSAREFAPHYLATYLYELAQQFNTYYSNTKIVTNDDAAQLRILMVAAVAYTIKNGLNLLGIQTVEKM